MPQTFLVIAASIILAIFGLNCHRDIAADERAVVGREIEAAALAVGERWTGIARDLAFDEADVNATQMRLPNVRTGLATRLGPDGGESLGDVFTLDDVDDLAGLAVVEDAAAGTGAVAFQVTATAIYAVPGTWAPRPAGSVPTTAKIVTIVVKELVGIAAGKTGRPEVRVTLPVRVSSTLQFVHTR